MSDIVTINTNGLEEAIRCAICENQIKTERGCNGDCRYDEKLLKRILDAVNGCIEPDPLHGEWILCSERLPEKHGYYIVQTDGSHNSVIDIAEFGRYWNLIWGWNKASKVIAWMPLPEPYKEEGEKNG